MYRNSRLPQNSIELSFFSFGSARGGKYCQNPEAFRKVDTFTIRIAPDRFQAFVNRRRLMALALPSQGNRQFAAALEWLLNGCASSAEPVPASAKAEAAVSPAPRDSSLTYAFISGRDPRASDKWSEF